MLNCLTYSKGLDFVSFMQHEQNKFPKIKKTIEMREFRCEIGELLAFSAKTSLLRLLLPQ